MIVNPKSRKPIEGQNMKSLSPKSPSLNPGVEERPLKENKPISLPNFKAFREPENEWWNRKPEPIEAKI